MMGSEKSVTCHKKLHNRECPFVLSDELLEIKNTEIRVLTEKLHEKDEFIRDMTIQYSTYLADYENRWGRYIDDYDRIMRELYFTKEHYIELLEQAYAESNKKDKETEDLIKKQKDELSHLKSELKRLKSYEGIVLGVVRQANMLEKSKDSPSLKDYVYNHLNAEKIEKLLRQHINPLFGKQRQALPIRAAHDAGIIKTIPYKMFCAIFSEATVSETIYNNITRENHDILPTLKTEYEQLKTVFESLNA